MTASLKLSTGPLCVCGTDLKPADEAAGAQLARTLDVLAQVLAVTPTAAFAYPDAQRALGAAEALLVEHGRGEPDRHAAVNALWLASKERR